MTVLYSRELKTLRATHATPPSSGRMLLSLALGAILLFSMAATPVRPARALRFPANRSLGVLMAQDASQPADTGNFNGNSEGWDYLGDARGDVAVPAGQRVWLIVQKPVNLRDLSPLAQLPPEALYGLTIRCEANDRIDADREILPHLRGLTGLRALDLNRVAITRRGMEQLAPLRSLVTLAIATQDVLAGPAPRARQLADDCLPLLAQMPAPEAVRLWSHDLTDDGLAQLPALPALRSLDLWSTKLRGPGLAHLAKLPALRSLRLHGFRLDDGSLAFLKGLTSLTGLNLSGTKVTGRGLAHLASLKALEELDLFATNVTDEGMHHLKSLPLRKLKLAKGIENRTVITDAGMAHVGAIRTLEQLETNGLSDKSLGYVANLENLKVFRTGWRPWGRTTDEGFRQMGRLRNLELLALGGEISDAGIATLAPLTNLRELHLMGAPGLTDEGLARIASLGALETLDIPGGTRITIDGLRHLNALTNLKRLHIGEVQPGEAVLDFAALTQVEDLSIQARRDRPGLTDADLASLARLRSLKKLQLCNHTIGDAGLAHLAGLTSLSMLNLSGGYVTDNGLRHLAGLRRLHHLTLDGDVTDRGLRHLESLKHLGYLNLRTRNRPSDSALGRLRQALPGLVALSVLPNQSLEDRSNPR